MFIPTVVARLQAEIGAVDCETYGDRFIFAVGVEQIECWVLPLWFHDAKGRQTANCTSRLGGCPQLRDALKAKNHAWISPEKKEPRSYDIASGEYRKGATLLKKGPRNPSLRVFLDSLDIRSIALPSPD